MGKGTMAAALLTGDEKQTVALGNYKLELSRPRFRAPAPQTTAAASPAAPPVPERSAALIIATGPDEYLVTGSGLVSVTFSPNSPGPPIAGIAYVEEGVFVDGRWVAGRRLNGDENGQGKFVRIGGIGNSNRIQRVRLYRYR
jgi:hypothetical protein